jgi:hypothetical protein
MDMALWLGREGPQLEMKAKKGYENEVVRMYA